MPDSHPDNPVGDADQDFLPAFKPLLPRKPSSKDDPKPTRPFAQKWIPPQVQVAVRSEPGAKKLPDEG